jgi:hypothetical protein
MRSLQILLPLLLLVTKLSWCMAHESELRGAQGTRQAQPAAIKVTKFRLVNADTDEPFPQFIELPDFARIDLSTLSTANLNVEAYTEGPVGSVQWSFDGTIRNDNAAPWSLCGNSGRDFFTCGKIKEGLKTNIRATPYTGKGATGTAGPTLSINVEFIKSGQMRLTLMEAQNEGYDFEIAPLVDGTTILLFVFPQINVRADVDSNRVKSVLFYYDGKVFRIDNAAPYSFAGNIATNFLPWDPLPTPGRHNITAVAYAEADAKGIILSKVFASFNVVATDITPPKLIDLKALTPLKVDIRNGPATIKLQAILQDDVSGIQYARAFATLSTASSSPPFAQPPFKQFAILDTSPQVWEISLLFDNLDYYTSGNYNLSLSFDDYASPRNTVTITTEELAKRNLPCAIQVVSKVLNETTPPRLLNFTALTSTKIDLSTGPTSVDFQVVAQDDGGGVTSGELQASIWPRDADPACQTLFSKFGPTLPIVGKPALFKISVDFAGCPARTYYLTLYLVDAYGNYKGFFVEDLLARGFPGVVDVVP